MRNISTSTNNNIPSFHNINLTNKNNTSSKINNAYFLLQNIRSMRENFDVFNAYIMSLDYPPVLICLSEIWIYSHEIQNYKLNSYNLYANCNDSYRSGGIAIFLHEHYKATSFSVFNFNTCDIVTMTVSLESYDFNFICIYRFHGKVDEFLIDLESVLHTYGKSQNTILMGDLNIDLLDECRDTIDYVLLLSSFGLESLCKSPTRITDNSSSCIDHVFINCCRYFNISVITEDWKITDHCCLIIEVDKLNKISSNKFNIVDKQIINYEKLDKSLLFEFWDDVHSAENVSLAFCNFLRTLNTHIKSSTEIASKKVFNKINPWMSDRLCALINKNKLIAKKSKRYPHNSKLNKYSKKLSKKVKGLTKITIQNYYQRKFDPSRESIRSIWKTIKSVVGENNIKQSSFNILDNEKNIVSNNVDVADCFNSFFIDNIETICENIYSSDIDKNLSDMMIVGSSYNESTFFCDPILPSEILFEIKKLDNKNSRGVDNICNFTLKKCSLVLVDVLCSLFNRSLEEGIFPDKMKIATVIPLHKKGDTNNMNNYRPISLLSSIAKIFEKIMKKRFLNYVCKIQFLNDKQKGFMAGKSTEDALLTFLSQIFISLNQSNSCMGLFIDIKKAFDTVNHKILLTKLWAIGFRGIIFNWIRSYLENRQQFVRVGSALSSGKRISVGVPQGSVLGPMLFLVYINSFFDLDLHGIPTAFADDMALSYNGKTQIECENQVNADLKKLRLWFDCHKMILSEKTKCITFDISRDLMLGSDIIYHDRSCNNSGLCSTRCLKIEDVPNIKYLGIHVDKNLNFSSHISSVVKSMAPIISKFYRLRKFCSKSNLRMLYYALVESRLQYGIVCWGGVYNSRLNSLRRAQKHIVKIINYKPRQFSSFMLFKKENWLPLRYLYVFKVLIMFFKRSGDLKLHQKISSSADRICTRNSNIVSLYAVKKEHFRRFYLYMAPYFFLKLPRALQTSDNISPFKNKLRDWLLGIEDIEIYF